ERDGLQSLPYLPRLFPEDDKGDQDPHTDIKDRKPDQPHPQICRLASKTDDCRGADEGRSVRERNHDRMGISPRDKVILSISGLLVPDIAQYEHDHHIYRGDDKHHGCANGHASVTPFVPVQVSINETGKGECYTEQICDPDLRVRDSKHDTNLLVISWSVHYRGTGEKAGPLPKEYKEKCG